MKIDASTFANTGAVALFSYGAYMLYNNQESLSQMDMGKYGLALLGGLGYLVYTNLDSLKGVFSRRKPSARVFTPADYEEQDFRCLVHLRNRVTEAECEEGVKTCEELNKIIFSLHAREKMKAVTNAKATN